MDVVFDINVLISALIKRGKPKELWLKAVRKEFELVSSGRILSDFLKVIGREKFQTYINERDIVDFLQAFRNTAKFVRLKSKIKVVKEDPDDDIILATAYDGNAEYIVSGDKHLLSLKEFKRIRIVTVDEMLKILKAKS
jgi:putative PIN family toxin of toxin-antitoxin system